MKSNTVKPRCSATLCSSALFGVYGERHIGKVASTRITFTRELLSTDYYRSYEKVELLGGLTLFKRYLSIKSYMQCSSYLVFKAILSLYTSLNHKRGVEL